MMIIIRSMQILLKELKHMRFANYTEAASYTQWRQHINDQSMVLNW